MPDVNSQAAQVEQVIQPGAQVPESTPTGNTQTEPQTESAPTLEDYRKIAREEAVRAAQSQVAKGENRINLRIQEQFAALTLNKAALGLSDDQVAQAKEKIYRDVMFSAEEPQTSASQTPDVDQAIRYMNAEIDNVFAEVGTSVTSADPEFKDLQKVIDTAWNDPRGLTKIIRAADKAATAKAGRIASQNGNAQARVIGGGAQGTSDPNDISGITDAKELYRLGEKKFGGKK